MNILLKLLSASFVLGVGLAQPRPLFNGEDFTGWGGEGQTAHLGHKVVEGMIVSGAGSQALVSEDRFTNYELRFEFCLEEGANSGIGLHYPGEGDPAYTGMECQVLDDSSPKYAELEPGQYHGSLYKLAAARRGVLKPVGEWNEEVIRVQGDEVMVTLNGVEILSASLAELEQDHPKHLGVKRREGHLVLCGHGPGVQFRNLTIEILDEEMP